MTMHIDDLPIPEETRLLVKRGIRIMPLRKRDKVPILKEWKNFATADPDQIAAWARKYLNCNWGIPTGTEFGFFVVDDDGEIGAKTIEDWSTAYGESWKQTLTCASANGLHFYYMIGQVDIRNSAKKIAPGIDIRGEGGQVVAPGSTHPTGHVYRIVNDLPIAPAPEWLLATLTRQKPATIKKGENSSAIVIQNVEDGVPVQRND
jgi:putative DNA primase/helicase